MTHLLGLVLISFFTTSLLLVPFIDFLFYLKNKSRKTKISTDHSATPIHNQLLAGKDMNTPVGGGIFIIFMLTFLSLGYAWIFSHPDAPQFINTAELMILIGTLLLFGFIGIHDDLRKIFSRFSGKFQGLRARWILLLQIICALTIGYALYSLVGLNNIFIPAVGNIVLGPLYIPLAAFAIISFANAYNFSDGLDGLSSGLLVICLFAYLVLAHNVFDPTLSMFVGIWIGCLIAYLYFNVYPARVYLGDAGAYGFGATLAVVGLLTGKIIGLAIIGGMYVIIVSSSLIQIFGKRFLGRKIFPVAPIHMLFKYIGWEEPKIVVRFWLAGIVFAILGLWLSLLSN